MNKININKLKERLERLSGGNFQQNRINCLWKPSVGEQFVRIVPNRFNLEDPFTELYFYFYLPRTMLSPMTFGRPDPIMEFVRQLRSTGNEDDSLLARKLQPTLRIYAPILVRGLEHEGVKFWAFSRKVYESLVSFFDDVDYGDLSNLTTGRDIKVTYTAADMSQRRQFPETTVLPKVRESLAFDPNDTMIRDHMKNQINITDLFKEPTYDELNQALNDYLNPPSEADSTEVTEGFNQHEQYTSGENVYKGSSTTTVNQPPKTPGTLTSLNTPPATQQDSAETLNDKFKAFFNVTDDEPQAQPQTQIQPQTQPQQQAQQPQAQSQPTTPSVDDADDFANIFG